MISRTTLLVFVCGVLCFAENALAAQPAPAERALRRSDVVFMYDNPKMYAPYGCTAMGWAGQSRPERIAAAHEAGVRLFTSSVGFLTEFSGAIDFSDDFLDEACRNFEGKPFIVPWLFDHKHKGQPAYWWCSNSPLYRRYLESRLEAVMKGQPDGLHIDDYRGTSGSVTWLSGGFCRHCMAAFREYLGKNVPKEKLATLGITDLSKFDYRQYLIDQGVTAQDYNKRRAGLPLAAEFHNFQIAADNAFVAEYRKRAEQLRGKPLALCVNSGLDDPQALAITLQLSYFCCEVNHRAAEKKLPTHPIYIYKLADGLNRPVASTASGQDWAFVKEQNLPGLVRSWIALSYAFGQTLMAPHHQWCYTNEKGTHWYEGPTEEYAYLYQFVRRNARLLDGYDAVAPVAVVYSNAAARKGRKGIEGICAELAGRNVPFAVVVAGDDWLDYRLTAEQLAGFKAVIVNGPTELDPKQQAVLDAVAKQGRLVAWPDDRRLSELVPAAVTLEGAGDLWVVPRAIPGDGHSPAAVHLVNRRYDAAKDAMVPQTGFTVKLRGDLYGGRRFTKATFHAPQAEPVSLAITSSPAATSITVPELKLWGMVELGE
ncbi:MAG: hypothetical protein ACYC35_20885 [Pirellulales bacterium]